MNKKLKLKKWVKETLIIISSIILYWFLNNYGYLGGVNYFYATLVVLAWIQLCIINVLLLVFIGEE